jgi:hypothetical protein
LLGLERLLPLLSYQGIPLLDTGEFFSALALNE